MFKKLEDYLQEIDHYLPVKGTAEILSKIRSHILEKTEQEFGPLTEDSIARIIAAYGSPQKVAQRYRERYEIISPTFQKHLFLYTAILFSFHFTLSVFSLILKKSMIVFPFFYISRMDVASEKWPQPEVLANVNNTELGNLGLTVEEEDAIVSFMRTLSDKR